MIRPREKRIRKVLTHAQAVDVLHAYHVREESQSSIAKRYGCSQTSVYQIVHGLSHKPAYAEVFPEPTSEWSST
jgi:DNA-binding transcriptional regulator LsrR (DeoR family)